MAIYTGTGGKRTGSVGGETYSVSKGQNIVRAKPVSVANPRSDAQMTQRTQFLSAVRFFQRANQRFFKFAFESKKLKESDYNAFMRLNANKGGYISKAQGDAVGFPMVAPWVITQGSLQGVSQRVVTDAENERTYLDVVLKAGFTGDLPTTIGEISTLLKESSADIQERDIMTLVVISTSMTGDSYVNDFDMSQHEGENKWAIQQFIIDSTDTRSISEILSDVTAVIDGGTLVLRCALTSIDQAGAAVMVQSRNTNKGLKVSTSTLLLNGQGELVYDLMRRDSHRQQILAWWGAQQAAILQGSEAQVVVPSDKPAVISVQGEYSLPEDYNFVAGTGQELTLGFAKAPTDVTTADFRIIGEDADEWDVTFYAPDSELTVTPTPDAVGPITIFYLRQRIIIATAG